MAHSLTQIWGNGDLDLFRSQIIFLSPWKLASSSVISFTQIWGNCICPTPNFIFAHCVHTKFVESQCFTSEYILILKEHVSVSHPILGEDAAEQYDDLLSSPITIITIHSLLQENSTQCLARSTATWSNKNNKWNTILNSRSYEPAWPVHSTITNAALLPSRPYGNMQWSCLQFFHRYIRQSTQ